MIRRTRTTSNTSWKEPTGISNLCKPLFDPAARVVQLRRKSLDQWPGASTAA